MKYRKLRIAWSVVWGVLALMLIVLWVRSYWRLDSFGLYGAPSTKAATSYNGAISASIIFHELGRPRWHCTSEPNIDPADFRGLLSIEFYDDRKQDMLLAAFPHWVGIVALVICASAPWTLRRFRLSTLLITTTLIAILLGLMVHANRID
jgi:hypothetical protein